MHLGKIAALFTVAVFGAVSLSPASAHAYRHHRSYGLPGAVGAVVGGAAEIVSAPFVLLGAVPGPRFHHARGYRHDEAREAYSEPAPAYYRLQRPSYAEEGPAYYAPPRETYGRAPQSYYGEANYGEATGYDAPCDREAAAPAYRTARAATWNGYGY